MTLNEAINYDKYSDKLDQDLFDWLVGLDPSAGKKYAPWIVLWLFKEHHVEEAVTRLINKGLLNLKGKNPWPLSLETVKLISLVAPSEEVARFYREDHSKVTKDLRSYDKLKAKNLLEADQKNIMNVKGFSELYDLVAEHEDDLDQIEIEDSEEKPEADKWFEDDAFLVVVPRNEIAARKYGANTRWCTAARENNQFEYYNRDGPLIVFINKETGEKWQVHIESSQWMDARDSQVDRMEFLENEVPAAAKEAVFNHTKSVLFHPNPKALFTSLFSIPEFSKRLSEFISGGHLKQALNDKDYDGYISDRMIDFGINDYSVNAGICYEESYSYGHANPDQYLDEEPAEDGEWSDAQREAAGMKAEEEAMDEDVKQVASCVLDNPSYCAREYGTKAYTEILEAIVDATFSDGTPEEKASMICGIIFTEGFDDMDRVDGAVAKFFWQVKQPEKEMALAEAFDRVYRKTR